ncbi:MAG: hypothetical protein ABSG78_24775 [Verrucomicrobiota bacterium]
MMKPADTPSAAATGDLPQRKVKKGILDVFRNLRAITSREGGLLPFASAATVLGVSKQRVNDLVKEGTLHPIDLLGKKWLSANELESFVKLQRQAGRPPGKNRASRNNGWRRLPGPKRKMRRARNKKK